MKSLLSKLNLPIVIVAICIPAFAEECDDELAKKVYGICAACHGQPRAENPPLGPSLKGLFGRESGSLPDFIYSVAMEKAKINWNAETLNVYLESPMTTVPGSSMAFAGIRDDHQRKNLICWLETFEPTNQD